MSWLHGNFIIAVMETWGTYKSTTLCPRLHKYEWKWLLNVFRYYQMLHTERFCKWCLNFRSLRHWVTFPLMPSSIDSNDLKRHHQWLHWSVTLSSILADRYAHRQRHQSVQYRGTQNRIQLDMKGNKISCFKKTASPELTWKIGVRGEPNRVTELGAPPP